MKRIVMFIMAVVFALTTAGEALSGEATPGTPPAGPTAAALQKRGEAKAVKKRVRKHRRSRKRGTGKKSPAAGERK